MEHADVVRSRRMVRAYDPARPVDDVVLTRLLTAATRAPSAGFSQGCDLLLLRGDALARYWATTTDRDRDPDAWLRGMRTAPVLVLCLSDPRRYVARYAEADKSGPAAAPGAARRGRGEGAWAVPWWDVDTGMSALLLLLGAVDEGLGACFVGVPDDRHDAVRAAFGIPDDRRLVGAVALGHPDPDRRSPSRRRGRRPLGEVIHEGRFGTPSPLAGPARD